MSSVKKSQSKGSISAGEACRVRKAVENKYEKSMEVKFVQCDLCDHWYHINCVGLDDKDYEYLMKAKKANKHIFWSCGECTLTPETKKMIIELNEKHDKLGKGVCELKADKNKIECEIEKLKRQIDIEFVKVSKELQEVRKEIADTITVTKADMQKMLVTDKTELDSALRDLQTEVKSTQSTDKYTKY